MNNIFSSNHTIYEPDGFNLDISCDNSKLKEFAHELICGLNDSFTFNQLCARLSHMLDKQNLFHKKSNTTYQGDLHINPSARKVLLQYIWELIWNRRLMIDLYVSKYRQDNSSFYLLKTDTFDE